MRLAFLSGSPALPLTGAGIANREMPVANSRGLSVHIGVINVDSVHYQGWDGRLYACEDDALAMQELARGRGFETEVLLTRDATRENVIRAIERASRELEEGDLFLLTYSGHGGQIPRQADGRPANLYDVESTDGLDETWCLHDAQLLDDELDHLYRQFRTGVRILLIQDCCHSGFSDFDDRALLGADGADEAASAPGIAVEPSPRPAGSDGDAERGQEVGDGRGAGGVRSLATARPKAMPKEKIGDTYEHNRRFYDGIRSAIPRPADGSAIHETSPASILAISACREHELALEGTYNGYFTTALLVTLEEDAFSDYDEFHEQLARRLSKITSAKQTAEMHSCATDTDWITTEKTAKTVPWAKGRPFEI